MTQLLIEQSALISYTLPLLLSLILSVMLVKLRKLQTSLSAQLAQTQDLQKAIISHSESQLAINDALTALQEKLAAITDRDLEVQAQAAISRSFDEASQMARQGMSAQLLVESYGLSNGEANLMVRLQQG